MTNRIKPKIGLVAVASPLEVGAGRAESLVSAVACTSEGGSHLPECVVAGVVDTPAAAVHAGRFFYDQRVDAIVVVAACWFEDYLVLDMLEECRVPVVLWAVPGMEAGSLCGCQQAGFMLRALGWPFQSVFAAAVGAHSSAPAAPVSDYTAVAAIRRRLRGARIGYLGHRVEGMTETTPHELALKRLFGPRVVGIDSQVFLARAAAVDEEETAAVWQRVKAGAGRVTCAEEAGGEAMRVYLAMKALVAEQGLSAVAVGCYPHLMGKVCLAASLLGEEGVPVACEGDVNGALGMLLLTWLSGEAVHNTDLLDPIPADNAIVFSHCGSGGFSLACQPDDINLAPVRLMDGGVCCQFPARPGPVTLVNIVPTLSGYRLATMFGQAIETDMVFPGNPLRVRFEVHYQELLAWVAREGLGHHWMAAYGDYRWHLRELAALVGCEYATFG